MLATLPGTAGGSNGDILDGVDVDIVVGGLEARQRRAALGHLDRAHGLGDDHVDDHANVAAVLRQQITCMREEVEQCRAAAHAGESVGYGVVGDRGREGARLD